MAQFTVQNILSGEGEAREAAYNDARFRCEQAELALASAIASRGSRAIQRQHEHHSRGGPRREQASDVSHDCQICQVMRLRAERDQSLQLLEDPRARSTTNERSVASRASTTTTGNPSGSRSVTNGSRAPQSYREGYTVLTTAPDDPEDFRRFMTTLMNGNISMVTTVTVRAETEN
jgi:hypothetical protein